MALDLSDARELFDRECSFPAERSEVIDAVGDRTIEPPSGTPVTAEEVIARSDMNRFESLSELHETLLTYLDDDHIGRKHYDDRSTDPTGRDEVSF